MLANPVIFLKDTLCGYLQYVHTLFMYECFPKETMTFFIKVDVLLLNDRKEFVMFYGL